MASTSTSRYGYQKLSKLEGLFQDENSGEIKRKEPVIEMRQRSFNRFRKYQFKRRLKVRIPSLRRLLTKKARLIRAAWRKVVKRLKENQHHLGDLFAGNYLFMQVSPTPLKTVHQKSLSYYSAAPDLSAHQKYLQAMASYSVGRDLSSSSRQMAA